MFQRFYGYLITGGRGWHLMLPKKICTDSTTYNRSEMNAANYINKSWYCTKAQICCFFPANCSRVLFSSFYLFSNYYFQATALIIGISIRNGIFIWLGEERHQAGLMLMSLSKGETMAPSSSFGRPTEEAFSQHLRHSLTHRPTCTVALIAVGIGLPVGL